MSASLLKILADFDTQLATAASVGGTSATIVTATDDDGNALPTGTYGLTIDGGNSAKEYIICTLTSTALTDVLSITRQGVTSSGFARAHRRGAKVTVTDWAILSRMLNNLDGTTGFNSLVKLGYDADPGLSTADANKFATVKYVDDTASAGAPDASTTTKGVTKLSATPVSPTDPIAVGDNDPRVPTQDENDALVGTFGTPSTSNPYITKDDPNILSLISSGVSEGLFGDGSDGDVVISSNTSLTRDMYYNNLTIDLGFTLNPEGFRIYVKGTFENNGTVASNGGTGGNGAAGGDVTVQSTAGAGGAGGSAGSGTPSGTLIGSLAGLAGLAGTIGGSITNVTGAAASGVVSLIPQGVAGSKGGNSQTTVISIGGAATLGTKAVTKLSTNFELEYLSQIIAGVITAYYPTQQNSQAAGGCGARESVGSGSSNDTTGGGGGAGGGGGNGGIVWIFANIFESTGTLSAIGGNGGNGGRGGNNNVVVGGPVSNNGAGSGGGGGTGGNGGLVIIAYGESYTNTGSIVVTGGTGGTAGIAGVDTGNGVNGFSGVNGLNGTSGTSKVVQSPIV